MPMGGYEYEFLKSPQDDLICKICHYPSREPCLSECCGHTFCKSCIDHAKRATTFYSCICPVCRSEEFKLIHNKQNERAINILHVYCPNKERGCEWQGEINDIKHHLKSNEGCYFEEINCPINCGDILQRKHLKNHLENKCQHRRIKCQYCHCVDKVWYIDSSHLEEYLKFPLPCPNNCGVSNIPREDMDGHRLVCPLTVIECTNKCGISIQQQYLEYHKEKECHRRKVDCMYCHLTDEFQYIGGRHIEKCPKLPLPCPNNCGMSDIPREDLNDHRETCLLEEVECPNKCGVCFQQQHLQTHVEKECVRHNVDCQYCHVTDELEYIEGEHVTKCPKFPLPCPNDCGLSDIAREDMDSHRGWCPLEDVECPNECGGYFLRKCLQNHSDKECPCREVRCQYCQTV